MRPAFATDTPPNVTAAACRVSLPQSVKSVEVTRVRDADIEDLFDPNFYLKLVNLTYSSELEDPVTMKAITESNPRIVERLREYFSAHSISGGEFDRYRPATFLLQNFEVLRSEISADTVNKIASLVERVNGLLPTTAQNNKPNNTSAVENGTSQMEVASS